MLRTGGELARWAAVAMTAFALSGCSSMPWADRADGRESDVAPELREARVAAITLALMEARTAGAGENQIAVLEKGVRTGAITFGDLHALTQDTLACLGEAGITALEKEPAEIAPGYLIPDYHWGGKVNGFTDKQVEDIGDKCIDQNSYYASSAYQDASFYQEQRDAAMRKKLPEIVSCLKENGVAVDPDATLNEVRDSVRELLEKTLVETNDTAPIQCYEDFIVNRP